MPNTNDILLIDKPKGITSFDVIRILRKKLGMQKIGHTLKPKLGHAGTLDPLATGLMIIGVDEGTKKLNEFLKLPKTYEVEILLGKRTTTGDLEGEVVEEKEITTINPGDVQNTLKNMVGIMPLPVPVYSAIKISGKPLYKRARSGETVVPPVKNMQIDAIELLDIRREGDGMVLVARMDVGSGAYVRSIAEEIGRRLDVPATVKELRRTRVGNFDIKDALKLDIPKEFKFAHAPKS